MPFDDGVNGGRECPVRIRLMGIDTRLWLGPPAYLAAYDVDANDGRGNVLVTHERTHAMVFTSPAAAIDAWRQQSRVRPLRPDNEPNRPLTAYTIQVEPC